MRIDPQPALRSRASLSAAVNPPRLVVPDVSPCEAVAHHLQIDEPVAQVNPPHLAAVAVDIDDLDANDLAEHFRAERLAGLCLKRPAILPKMCGRFTLRTPARDLVEIFQLFRTPEIVPRYNISPTQPVAVVRQVERRRELSMMRWGLVPAWSKDPKAGPSLINARADTVATKPAFRSAFKSRRCLIPADGFFEWQKTGEKTKQPFYIRLAKDYPFAFAGLWEHWEGPTRRRSNPA